MSNQLKKPVIRVVSYNVHFGENTKEIVKVFRHDKNLSTADVILFQEIESHPEEKVSRAEVIGRELGFHFVYEPARTLKNFGTHGLATISRYPIKNTHSIKLPEYKMFFLLQTRIALVINVEIAGINITVCNVHLDTRLNPKQRMHQLNACLIKLKEDYGQNIVIGGDFNTIQFRSILRGFPIFYSNQLKYLNRNMINMGFKYSCGPLGYTMKSGLLKMRLDHIYTDRLPITKCGVERDVSASDHIPVWADIEIS